MCHGTSLRSDGPTAPLSTRSTRGPSRAETIPTIEDHGADPVRASLRRRRSDHASPAAEPEPVGRTLSGVPPKIWSPSLWGAHLLALVLLAGTVGLGLWQIGVWQDHRSDAKHDATKAAVKPLDRVIGP